MHDELFYYDNGILRWKISRRRVSADAPVGWMDTHGYVKVRIKRKNIMVHRIVYEMHFGRIKDGLEIDHINGIRHDNRIENLRAVSKSVNQLNRAKQSNNTSGVTGVRWHTQRNRWRAQFRDEYLGLFETIEEAEAAYKAASDGFVTERHGI